VPTQKANRDRVHFRHGVESAAVTGSRAEDVRPQPACHRAPGVAVQVPSSVRHTPRHHDQIGKGGTVMAGSESPAESEKAKFDEVMDTEEHPHPNRREHAKANPRPDEDELERRTEIERSEVGLPEEEDA
jgi:hypothetical protein